MSEEQMTYLVLSEELPADFFVNVKYANQLRAAIESTRGLVYSLDDAGEKMAKADATAINKLANQYKKFIGDVFKRETDEVARWRADLMGLVNELLDNRQNTLDQFAETRLIKLAEIRTLLMDTLVAAWDKLGVKAEHRKADVEPLVIYSSLTGNGKLTGKAVVAVMAIAEGNLGEQNRIAARHMLIENRCLKEGINPPLTHIHLGTTFYTADDATFDAKVNELIAAEIQRKAEMEERISRRNEESRQRELRDQQEAHDRELKRQKEENERELNRQLAQAQAEHEHHDEQNRNIRPASPTTAAPPSEPAPALTNGKRTVVFTATFEVIVPERVSDAGVEAHFRAKLPEDLVKILKKVEFAS